MTVKKLDFLHHFEQQSMD